MWKQLCKRAVLLGAAVVLFAGSATGALRAEEGILVKSGETIAFLGDSITEFGWKIPGGYVNLVISGLKANGIEAKLIPAGISGNKSNQMLERLKKDVLDKKPAWMTLSCGVNDVWHGPNGVTLDKYKENITAIVDQAQAAGVKVVILTATMIQEVPDNEANKKLAGYNDFLRELAAAQKLPIADLNADMQKKLAELKSQQNIPGNRLTTDGVHMNPWGNLMMATGVLRAFGLNDAQLKTAQDYWMSNVTTVVNIPVNLTLQQFEQLQKISTSKSLTVDKMLAADLKKTIETYLATPAQ